MTFLKQSPKQTLRFLAVLKDNSALLADRSMAISRCLNMARRFGAQVDVFMPSHCSDATGRSDKSRLTPKQSDPLAEPIDAETRQRLTSTHCQLTAFVNRHDTQNLDVTCMTAWTPESERPLQHKIDTVDPDLVFVDAEANSFGWGLADTEDWRLLRDSQVPVWFVQSTKPLPQEPTLLAAVGSSNALSGFSEVDIDILQLTQELADLTDGATHAVHAVQDPNLRPWTAGAALGGAALSGSRVPPSTSHTDVVAASNAALHQLAHQLPSPPDALHLCKGPAKDAVPAIAREVDADVVVLGAKPLGFWARLIRSVTAEPVLAELSCDVIYVPANLDPRPASPAAQITPPQAVQTVAAARAPRRSAALTGIAEARHLSAPQKRRILRSLAGTAKRQAQVA